MDMVVVAVPFRNRSLWGPRRRMVVSHQQVDAGRQ
jgi:hypothetical protein